jgi:CheY-like chemotaxis protein
MLDKSCQNSGSSLRVLLAEDEPSNRKVTMLMLEHLGYSADAVANGIEALQAMEHQTYDVVLMDVKMPEMDGLEATRIIRQRWPNNGPRIIAITAYALNGDREKCLDAGMDGYLAKPIWLDELRMAIETCVRLA